MTIYLVVDCWGWLLSILLVGLGDDNFESGTSLIQNYVFLILGRQY
jgi:hypothetical protein